jgi:hypothetical protein
VIPILIRNAPDKDSLRLRRKVAAWVGAGFVGAVVGAVILLAIYHFVKRRSASSPRY